MDGVNPTAFLNLFEKAAVSPNPISLLISEIDSLDLFSNILNNRFHWKTGPEKIIPVIFIQPTDNVGANFFTHWFGFQ